MYTVFFYKNFPPTTQKTVHVHDFPRENPCMNTFFVIIANVGASRGPAHQRWEGTKSMSVQTGGTATDDVGDVTIWLCQNTTTHKRTFCGKVSHAMKCVATLQQPAFPLSAQW